jgi:xanthine dehydrogenase accessory factor
VGLDIGAETPEEVALSIAAEIAAVLRGRDGVALSFREGPIHMRENAK